MNEWAYHLSMISQSILRGTAHVLSVAKISTGAPKCFQLFSKPSTTQTLSKRTLLLCCFSGTATPAGAHFLLQKQSSAAASLGSIKTPFVGQQYSFFSTTRSVSSKSLIFNSMADTTNTNNTEKKKVCIVGSGNWGSAIAKIIGNNVKDENAEFDSTVNMYVYEEMFEGKKLSEIINEEHENKKYLPGIKLPDNVKAVTDLPTAADGADILVFVVPHQFIRGMCKQLNGKVKKGAMAISLIKGLDVKEGGGLLLISDVITECISIPCHVLMGANLAGEVAAENYCEATVGARNKEEGLVLKRMLQTDYFRLVVVEDAVTVEICGALKNIVAVGAGFADGLGYGDNTKAAVIRLGLMEMIKFVDTFYEGTKPATFLESCGVADLVTTCYGGRNRRVAEAMVKTKKSIDELEKEMLNGQKLQGPPTALEVNVMLKAKKMEDTFPLFTAVHKICLGELEPKGFIDCLKSHPEHM